jgi:hypothetical protein
MLKAFFQIGKETDRELIKELKAQIFEELIYELSVLLRNEEVYCSIGAELSLGDADSLYEKLLEKLKVKTIRKYAKYEPLIKRVLEPIFNMVTSKAIEIMKKTGENALPVSDAAESILNKIRDDPDGFIRDYIEYKKTENELKKYI